MSKRDFAPDASHSVLTSVSYELLKKPAGRIVNLYVLTGLAVMGMLAWSAFARIDVMIFGTGKVVPVNNVQMVQHYEGGIVAEIGIKSGDRVEQGDVLLRIDNISISSELAETREQLLATLGEVARLNAETSGKPLKFSDGLRKDAPAVVSREQQLYRQRQQELKQSLAAFDRQLRKNRQEQGQLQAQLGLLAKNISLMQEELALSEQLVNDGALSPVELLRMRRSLHQQTVDRQRTGSERLAKQNEANRTAQAKAERLSQFKSEALARRNELETRRTALEQRIAAASERVGRSNVVAPVSGTVNQVLVNTVGGVVQSGMDLVEIVPDDKSLIMATKIRPEDIAFLAPGQRALVRITAYDFAIFGSLEGEVVTVGADTIEEQDGSVYYTAQIRTDKATLGENGSLPILPGMIAQVDIITGQRTVLSYLAKPIARAGQRALREH